MNAPLRTRDSGSDFSLMPVRRPAQVLSIPSTDEQGQITDIAAPAKHSASWLDLPAQSLIADQPVADGGGTGDGGTDGGMPETDNICDQPISMTKVVAGAFQGGKTMDDYYPDLAGRGYYAHPGTAGTFDTGTRVGANAQLYGDIRIPCRPDLFTLAQTVTYTRAIFDGVHDPKEGIVQDDIAKSGRDFTRAPSRQEWFGGGGWIISMADPPSVTYGPTTNIEFDRDFETSLVGPGGRRSVNWSTSIRVANGSVTTNTIS